MKIIMEPSIFDHNDNRHGDYYLVEFDKYIARENGRLREYSPCDECAGKFWLAIFTAGTYPTNDNQSLTEKDVEKFKDKISNEKFKDKISNMSMDNLIICHKTFLEPTSFLKNTFEFPNPFIDDKNNSTANSILQVGRIKIQFRPEDTEALKSFLKMVGEY